MNFNSSTLCCFLTAICLASAINLPSGESEAAPELGVACRSLFADTAIVAVVRVLHLVNIYRDHIADIVPKIKTWSDAVLKFERKKL